MNERPKERERHKHATVIRDLLLECRDKVPNDCLEPTLILSDATVRQYVKEIERTAWTSRTGLEGYRQAISDHIDRIEEIRDELPTDWQDFSNWLENARGTAPNVSTARPLPPQSKPTAQAAPLRNKPVSYSVSPAIKTPSLETARENIDPALLAIDEANEKDAMEIDTNSVFANVQNGASQMSSTNANTVPPIKKATSETVTTKPSLVSQAGNPNNHAPSAVSGNSQGDVVMGSVITASDAAAQDAAVGPNQKANGGLKSVGSHSDSASMFKLPGIAASFPAPVSFNRAPTQPTLNASQPANTSTLPAPKWTPAIGEKAVPVSNVFDFCTPKGSAAVNPFISPNGGSIFGNLDAGAKTKDKPFSFSPGTSPERRVAPLKLRSSLSKSTAGESVSVKPIEKTSPERSSTSSSSSSSATRDASPRKSDSSSSASSPDSTPSKTDFVVPSTNDGTLEMILSLLKEESAARIEPEAKRADADMKQKQKQKHEEVLQRIASLEKNQSSMKEAMNDKQKELDEREAAVSKREEAVKALQAKLEADISRQATAEKAQLEKEKAFTAKAEETWKALSQLQAKADQMQKKAEVRLAKTMTPVMSATKQEEPVKATVLASASNANDKVVSEADKVARPKRKPSQIVKILNKAFLPEKAVIVFHELKHGVLRMSKVGKAQLKDVEAQADKVLRLYERPASKREQHGSMLIDLINFQEAIDRNDDGPYRLLNATVKDAAIEFADEALAKYLFRDNNRLQFRKVSEQHKNMQAIMIIARLGASLFDMNFALSSAEEPDEFDDEEISVTPSEILKKYYGMFSEYESALRRFVCVVPESFRTHAPLKAHKERENSATYDGWTKAARKFGVKAWFE